MSMFAAVIWGVVILLIALLCGVIWAAAVIGARADRRTMVADADAFTPSMDRFGYVQDARNRGDV